MLQLIAAFRAAQTWPSIDAACSGAQSLLEICRGRRNTAGRNRAIFILVVVTSLLRVPEVAAAGWKAGVARANITPTEPLWLAGYANREAPADGKVMELWVKVLALEDSEGHRGILLTSDTLGFTQPIYRSVTKVLAERYALKPQQIVLSASHTHCGPVLRGALHDMYPLDDPQRALIEKYSDQLEASIVEAAGRALADLAPARLAAGQGITRFAVNRRNNFEPNIAKLIAEGSLKGPVDHVVPVLTVANPDGKLKAVLFGYACHNTVMAFQKWSGDYAGFAQLALEKSHPGMTAMFFSGCGADQNPLPRRQLELAERYGNMLASAVEEVLLAPPTELTPELATSMEMVTLNLGTAPSETELEKLKSDQAAPTRRWAERLLGELRAGKTFIRTYPYPVQVWQFGGSQIFVTLGGEVVVDYALKLKAEFGAETWVAAYCNDVMAYIPSLRILREGGYEGGGAMIVYGLPALRWAEDVEELISASVRRQAEQANIRRK